MIAPLTQGVFFADKNALITTREIEEIYALGFQA
jgi:hypothetical protein